MGVIKMYEEYISKIKCENENVCDYIDTNYIPIEDLMLRGNNKNNVYNSERIKIGMRTRD